MQYCLYVNPTLDKTIELGKLVVGETNRAESVRVEAGGKGVNVARVLRVLGGDPRVVGFVYRNGGDVVREALGTESVFYDFHEEAGVPRVNTKIVDKSAGKVTEINETGAPVPRELLSRCADELVNAAFAGDSVILSGSLPAEAPEDYYAGIINRLKEKSVRVYLDASGDVLASGIQAGPYMVKPNLAELEEIAGKPIETLGEALEASRDLISRYGIHTVVVSFGARGSMAADAETMAFAAGLPLDIGSTVGAGDAMLAGLVARADASLVEMLKSGAAAASGAVVRKGTAPCAKDQYDQFYDQIAAQEGPDLAILVKE